MPAAMISFTWYVPIEAMGSKVLYANITLRLSH
jgi:hypothetical protein